MLFVLLFVIACGLGGWLLVRGHRKRNLYKAVVENAAKDVFRPRPADSARFAVYPRARRRRWGR